MLPLERVHADEGTAETGHIGSLETLLQFPSAIQKPGWINKFNRFWKERYWVQRLNTMWPHGWNSAVEFGPINMPFLAGLDHHLRLLF